jgi:O-antigen ligase
MGQRQTMNALRAPAVGLSVGRSAGARVALGIGLAAFLVACGWVVSTHDVLVLGGLILACVFAATVLVENAVLYVLPLTLVLPSLGLMVPGLYAILVWDAFTIGFAGGVIARRVLTRRAVLTVDPWFRRLLLLFIAVAAASLIQGALAGAGVFMKGLKEVIRLVELAVVLFALAGELTSEDRILILARNVVLAGFASAVIALACYFWLPDFLHNLLSLKPVYVLLGTFRLRLVSTAGNVAETGQFFLMMLGFSVLYLFRASARARPLALVAVGVFLAAIFLTYNKGSWLALLVGLGIAVVRGGWRHRVPAALAVIVALAAVLVLVRARDDQKADIFATDLERVSRSSGSIRIQRWLALSNILTRQPVFGVGYNTFAYLYGEYSVEPGAGRPYGHPHNLFADVLAGTGLVGFAVFMAMGLRLARLARSNYAQAPSRRLRDLSFTLYIIFWFFIGGNMATSFLFKPDHPAFLMTAVAAMILAIHRLPDEAAPQDAPSPPSRNRNGRRPV